MQYTPITNGIKTIPMRRRVLSSLLTCTLALGTATAAMAQSVTGSSVSPSTYSAVGQTLTFTVTMNSGNELVSNPSVTSSIGVSYSCSPSSSSSTGANITCSGTYIVQPSNLGTGNLIVEVASAQNRGNGYSPTPVMRASFLAVQQSQSITFTDPTDIASATLNQSVNLTATATSGLSVAFSSATPSVCSVSGVTARVLAAGTCRINADQSGNASFLAAPQVSQSFTISAITDTTPPVVTVPNDIAVDTDAGQPTAAVSYSASFTDNEAGGSLVLSPVSGSVFSLGTTVVTATATDAAGNSASDTFNVTVSDNEAPSVSVPANITVNAVPGADTAVLSYAASFVDNVPGGALSLSPASGATFPIGTTTVTATATDAAGNAASRSFSVTVRDVEAPIVNVPANISVNTDSGMPTAAVTYTATFSDNAAGGDVVLSPASGSAFSVGTTVVTATATDASGNQDVDTFTVTVSDIEAPVLSIPATVAANTDASAATANVSFAASFTDNVPGGSLVLTPASGSSFPIGTTAISAVATDVAGNQTSGSFNVVVSDNEAPIVSVPAGVTTSADPGLTTATVNFTTSATDNDTVASFSVSPASGSVFDLGATTVTATATDTAGNVTMRTFTVTVTDDEAPVVSVPADIIANTDPGADTAVLTYAASFTDNNGGGSLVLSPASGTAFAIGETIVTATATDAAGNQTSRTFNVTVRDNEAPVLTVPDNITVDTDLGSQSAVVTFSASVADNAASATVVLSPASGSIFNVGTSTVTATATDASGNMVTDTFTVTVVDNEAPAAPIIVVATNGDGTVTVSGTTEPDATVSIRLPDGTQSSVTAQGNGSFSVTSAAPQPSGQISATSTDRAENTSRETTQAFVDTTPPATATAVQVTTLADNAIIVRATAEIGATVEVTFPDGTTQSVPVNLDGSVSVTSAPGQPTGDVQIVVVDAAGNRAEIASIPHTAPASVIEVQEQIATFLQSRAASVLSAQPDLTSLMSVDVTNAFNVNATRERGNFDFSTGGNQPLWARVQGEWSKTDGREASYFLGAVGAHINVSTDALLGVLVEFDQFAQADGDTDTDGTGYLVGPYFVAKLPNQPLYFEGRYLTGKSVSEVRVDGTEAQEFETDRTLASAKVAGQLIYGDLILTPSLSAAQYTDTQDAFVDNIGRDVAGQEIEVKDVSVGLDFAKGLNVETGNLTLVGGVSGISSETTGSGRVGEFAPAFDGQRARVHLGTTYDLQNGIVLSGSASYDGIGTNDYESISLQFGFDMKF